MAEVVVGAIVGSFAMIIPILLFLVIQRKNQELRRERRTYIQTRKKANTAALYAVKVALKNGVKELMTSRFFLPALEAQALIVNKRAKHLKSLHGEMPGSEKVLMATARVHGAEDEFNRLMVAAKSAGIEPADWHHYIPNEFSENELLELADD